AGETEGTADAHAEYFSTVAAAVFDDIRSGEQIKAIARTEADLDNLRSGFRRATDSNPDAARKYLECLWFIHEIKSWFPAGRDLFAEAASTAEQSTVEGTDRIAALSKAKQSWYISLMGSAEDGLVLASAAHEAVMELDPTGADACLAQQCLNIGLLFLNPEGIREGTKEAVSLAVRDGDEWWRMTMSVWEAYSYISEPSDIGVQMALDGIEYFSSLGDHWVQVWPLGFLGLLAEQSGDLTEARRRYEQSLAIGRDIGFGRIIQYSLNSLGRVTTEQGDFEQAEKYLGEGLALSLDGGQEREVLAGIVDFAAIRIGQERWAEASRLLAVVASDPLRTQRTAFASAAIIDLANELQGRLEQAVGPEGSAQPVPGSETTSSRDVAVALVAEQQVLLSSSD
ncbi:MAG: tetratricopeptide repeat protein, partial [Acidimicrobiia bacterium]